MILDQGHGSTDNNTLRVSFIHAPDPFFSFTQGYGAKFMPVWAYTLSAHIPEDGRFDVALHDTRFQKDESIAEADVFHHARQSARREMIKMLIHEQGVILAGHFSK